MDRNQKLIELYAKCLANNYNDMSNETQQLKVKVFAMDLGLKYKKIETLFEEAKTAYEQHQLKIEREAQIEKNNAEIDKKIKQLQKNAKLAFTAKDIDYGEIKVYRCADGSVFCKQDNKTTKYTDIEITVKAGSQAIYTYHPSKTVYTGASAGGITMGGFHTTEAHYTQSQYKTEKGSIEIHYDDGFDDSSTIEVESITLAPEIAVLFKRLPGYKKHFTKNKVICYDRSKSDSYWEATKYTADQGMRMELVSAAQNEAKCSYEKCAEIADILNSIIHNDFPAQDEEIYEKAIELSEIKDIAHLGKAIELFEYIIDYNDSKKHLDKIRPVYDELVQTEKEQKIIQKEKKQKKKKKIFAVSVIAVCVCTVIIAILNVTVMPVLKYNIAVALMESGKYKPAITVFEKLDDYKNSKDNLNECRYNETLSLLDEGKRLEAMGVFIKIDSCYKKSDVYRSVLDKLTMKETLSTSGSHTVGLKTDGTVVAVGNNDSGQCEVSSWTDIVAISAGGWHTVGLKSDGTVVAVGNNDSGQCEVSSWTDIVAISTDDYHTVGLKSDGTVVATEYTGNYYSGQCDVSDWTDIVAISASSYYTVGLKSDGTVVVTAGESDSQKRNISDWTDIIAISAGDYHTVGLKSDGTVVSTAEHNMDRCKVSDWTDIVAISAYDTCTVGLKADGTFDVITNDGLRAPFGLDWTDIVAISCTANYKVGLKSDGTVVAAAKNDKGESDISDWNNIKLPNSK